MKLLGWLFRRRPGRDTPGEPSRPDTPGEPSRPIYANHVERDRRLIILRLAAKGNGSINDRMAVTGLGHWGIRCTLGTVSQSLDWLAAGGFVKLRAVPNSTVRVAEITRRGRDIADGLDEVPGITPRRLVAD